MKRDQRDKPTSARPKIIDGVTFRCYPGSFLGEYFWKSDDGRLRVFPPTWPYRHQSYGASVDGVRIDRNFRSLENAMKSARESY